MSFADIRKTARKQHSNCYATGGKVTGRKPSVVVNVIGGQGAAPGPGPTPPPMPAPAPMAPPPAPGPGMVPPVAGNAALGAMGAPPMLATGGKVKAGAASGVHRQAMQRKGK